MVAVYESKDGLSSYKDRLHDDILESQVLKAFKVVLKEIF